MKARKSLWLVLLSVVAITFVLLSVLALSPLLVERLSPQAALAEQLPPEVSSPATQLQATGTLHTLSITTASFVPRQDGLDWFNDGNRLFLDSGSGTFLAPFVLPQGAKVTKMVVFGSDNNPAASYKVRMIRAKANTATWGVYGMTATTSVDSATTQKNVTTNISWPTINYESYNYHLEAEFTGPNVLLYTVKIVYYY